MKLELNRNSDDGRRSFTYHNSESLHCDQGGHHGQLRLRQFNALFCIRTQYPLPCPESILSNF